MPKGRAARARGERWTSVSFFFTAKSEGSVGQWAAGSQAANPNAEVDFDFSPFHFRYKSGEKSKKEREAVASFIKQQD